MSIKGKTALVTGSSRSLGKSIAISLAKSGANVVINHRDSEDEAIEVAKEIEDLGVQSLVVQAEVSKKDDVLKMSETVHEKFGGVDILVNNVGTSAMVPFLDMTDEDWHQIIGINLHSFFYCTQTFIRHMVKNQWGRIINITGHASLRGSPFAAHTVAGKGGAVGFTRSIATEFADQGITCNNVAPGHMDTPPRRPYYTQLKEEVGQEWYGGWISKIPMKKLGDPDEFGALCAFLASENASYITGQMFLVNGGIMYS